MQPKPGWRIWQEFALENPPESPPNADA